MSRESQREFILRLLKLYGRVDAHALVFTHGITRAGARIFELRQEGYPIVTERGERLPDGTQPMAVYRYVAEPEQGALPW